MGEKSNAYASEETDATGGDEGVINDEEETREVWDPERGAIDDAASLLWDGWF